MMDPGKMSDTALKVMATRMLREATKVMAEALEPTPILTIEENQRLREMIRTATVKVNWPDDEHTVTVSVTPDTALFEDAVRRADALMRASGLL